jgi:hypothetical protein
VAEFGDCVLPDRANTIEEDASLDGYAAVTQAKEIVHQPPETAIYFGVDFDVASEDGRKKVLSYFQIIHRIVIAAHYKVGIYGNGSVADLLYSKDDPKKRLVDYVWLNASSGHQGSPETFNRGHWDLLQTKTDTTWTLSGKDAQLDTDIQNPASRDIGTWSLNKSPPAIPVKQNKSILEARRFVCNANPSVFDDNGTQIQKDACSRPLGIVVRVLATDSVRGQVRVDCHENGNSDGWMGTGDLSKKRPIYTSDPGARRCSSSP